MMQCLDCHTQMEADARFCPSCGLAAGGEGSEPKGSSRETLSARETISGQKTLDGKSKAPQNDLVPGTTFAGRYVIEAIVGRGGMGVVYRALDKLAHQTVALKLIRPDRAEGAGAIERLILEGTHSRKIRHKNVIAVYDVGEVGGQPFVSMEYLDHDSLRAWHRQKMLNREAIPLRVAARIIMEVLDGLQAAHDTGIVHRDLKPENIILTAEPNDKTAPLKILDFGIASFAGAATNDTSAALGTIGYMAPEQKTNPGAATASADIYSVSVLLYELLMDAPPELHRQPPSGARSDVPLGIDRLIEEGFSTRPANRPQSAGDYRKKLIKAINDDEKPLPLPSPAGNVPAIVKWMAGGFGALLVLGMLGSMVPDPVTTEPPVEQGTFSPPIDPPPRSSFAGISGTWHWDDGTQRRVNVASNGTFSYDWPDSNVSGQFRGWRGQFTQTSFQQPLTFTGTMTRTDECHIDFETYAPDGRTLVASGRIHANHLPGAPCP